MQLSENCIPARAEHGLGKPKSSCLLPVVGIARCRGGFFKSSVRSAARVWQVQSLCLWRGAAETTTRRTSRAPSAGSTCKPDLTVASSRQQADPAGALMWLCVPGALTRLAGACLRSTPTFGFTSFFPALFQAPLAAELEDSWSQQQRHGADAAHATPVAPGLAPTRPRGQPCRCVGHFRVVWFWRRRVQASTRADARFPCSEAF